jgi:hypothetical protein
MNLRMPGLITRYMTRDRAAVAAAVAAPLAASGILLREEQCARRHGQLGGSTGSARVAAGPDAAADVSGGAFSTVIGTPGPQIRQIAIFVPTRLPGSPHHEHRPRQVGRQATAS